MKFLWILTAAGAVLGTLVWLLGVVSAKGAPQEAAAAAIGIALGVLPYVFTRAVQEMKKPPAG